MNIKNFDLNLLRVFNAIYEERNVSRAASTVMLSQPAMSNALTRLRTAFDDPLFVRTPRGMEPTEVALKISGPIREAVISLENAINFRQTFDPHSIDRRFRIGLSDLSQMIVIPRVAEKLRQLSPLASIECIELSRDGYADALVSGHIDVAIGHVQTLKSNTFQLSLFHDSYCCVTAKGYLGSEEILTTELFETTPHIAIRSGGAEPQIDKHFSDHKKVRITQVTVPHYLSALKLVSRTPYIATLPKKIVEQSAGDRIHVFKCPIELHDANIRMFWHSRTENDPVFKWIRQIIAELYSVDLLTRERA